MIHQQLIAEFCFKKKSTARFEHFHVRADKKYNQLLWFGFPPKKNLFFLPKFNLALEKCWLED